MNTFDHSSHQVCHSFVLLGMVTTIYACIAVELFKGVSDEQDVRAFDWPESGVDCLI